MAVATAAAPDSRLGLKEGTKVFFSQGVEMDGQEGVGWFRRLLQAH